jgi:hypothetical protein
MPMKSAINAVVTKSDVVDRVTDALLKLAGRVPGSTVRASSTPDERAKRLILKASVKSAMVSGTLALPPGPLGLLTVLPDLVSIWKIQQQLVADLAAVYGQSAKLVQSTMIYCLFKHAAAQAVRDVVMRAGERFLVREATPRVMQRVLRRVGISVSERATGRAISRWLPVIGAVGIGGYAFFDTTQVGRTAVKLFRKEIVRGGGSGEE